MHIHRIRDQVGKPAILVRDSQQREDPVGVVDVTIATCRIVLLS